MASATVKIKPDPEILSLADRLERLIEIFKDCAVRVLELKPGDVIVLESNNPVTEKACEILMNHARLVWPNNKAAVIDRGLRVAGVTREVDEPPETPASRAANAAVNRCYTSDTDQNGF